MAQSVLPSCFWFCSVIVALLFSIVGSLGNKAGLKGYWLMNSWRIFRK